MLIGGNLTVWSEVDAGTEVELCVSCRQRLHDSSERFLVVAKVCGQGMSMIRRNAAWRLRGASRILLLCIIHALYAAAAQPDPAQGGPVVLRDLKFTHLTTNDGLSQSYVVAILQDRRGFMWFATRDGLNRYDGNAFVVYKNNPNDSGSLSSNFLQDLMQDDHGYLWIATNTGVNKFDPETERCTRYLHDPDNPNSSRWRLGQEHRPGQSRFFLVWYRRQRPRQARSKDRNIYSLSK